MPLRRPLPSDDELPVLPPLDGDEGEGELTPDDGDPDAGEAPASLDDTASDELTVDEDFGSDDTTGPHDPHDDDEDIAGTEDDADEIPDDDGARWTDPEATDEDPSAESFETAVGDVVDDRGEDGPANDSDDELGELPPLDDDGTEESDDPIDPLPGDPGEPVAAFEFLTAPAVRVRRLRADGTMHAAVLGTGRLLIVGDALWSIALDALADPDLALATLDAPDGEVFGAVVEDPAGTVLLGSTLGAVYRKTRQGSWQVVRRPGEGRAAGSIDTLFVDGRRVWARTRGGMLLRTDEGSWREAPFVTDPVTALTVDDTGVALAVSARGGPELRVSTDGGRTWGRLGLPGTEPPWLLARAGETLAIAPGAGEGPGRVSIDGGRSWAAWPMMNGATALALTETDDGVPLVVIALYDEADDRSVVLCARVSANATPVDPRRLCVIERSPEDAPTNEGDGDEPWCRVEAMVPVDRAGQRIVIVATRQVVVVERGG